MDFMPRRLATAAIGLVLFVIGPAAAQARSHAQPLLDVAPQTTYFKDAVLHSSRSLRAHTSATTVHFQAYPTTEGYSVGVAISPNYVTPDPAIARSYVDFLDSLPHSTELAKLGVYIAPPAEVLSACGGAAGTLACYDSGSQIMVVPGEQTDQGYGVSTSYVVTHEYGHHIATFRSNAPFNAFTTGPKYWSSYEMVCDKSIQGQLFPGDEGDHYAANPGEDWAETYAHLKYRDQAWTFAPFVAPDDGAYAAAARDIGSPWTQPVTRVFKGTFGRAGTSTRTFQLTLNLDGAMSLRLKGPAKTNYNLAIASDGGGHGKTTAAGSRDSLSYKAVCRSLPAEHVTITVKRVKGAGPFTLRTTYAG